MANVLLINPPIREREDPTMFPLGIAYIASALRNAGHKVKILDIYCEGLNKKKVEERIKEIKDIDLIGTGGLVTLYSYIKFLCDTIKKYHDIPIMVGGSLPSSAPEIVLNKTKADILIFGEGEIPAVEIANRIQDKKGLEGIKGIWFKKEGKIIKEAACERIENIDNLAIPAYDMFDIDKYASTPVIVEGRNLTGKRKKLYMLTGRGCPQRCAFCYRNFGRKVAYRSIDKILDEIKYLYDTYNIKFVGFLDETFTIKKERVMEFCTSLIELNLDFRWTCCTRVDLVDKEILTMMRKAGCDYICFGIESGSQKMLDLMHKDITVEQSKKAIELCKQVGILANPSFMLGFPGETEETIRESIEFCKEVDLPVNFFITCPYPGTEIYGYAIEKGLIKDKEKFIENLSKQGDAYILNVNLTKFSDEKLLELRKNAYNEVMRNYFKNNRLRILKYTYFRVIGLIKGGYNIYKKEGIKKVLIEIRKRIGFNKK